MPMVKKGRGRTPEIFEDDFNAFGQSDEVPLVVPKKARKKQQTHRSVTPPCPCPKPHAMAAAGPSERTTAAGVQAMISQQAILRTRFPLADPPPPPSPSHPLSPPDIPDEPVSGVSYEAALRARQGVHQLDLDSDSLGHAIFAMLDCSMDRFDHFDGLLVRILQCTNFD